MNKQFKLQWAETITIKCEVIVEAHSKEQAEKLWNKRKIDAAGIEAEEVSREVDNCVDIVEVGNKDE